MNLISIEDLKENVINKEDRMAVFNINDLVEESNSKSFHIFSEKHFRGQVIRFEKEQSAKDYKLNGTSLFIILLNGKIKLKVDDQYYVLEPLMQSVIPEGKTFGLVALEDSVVEYIWSPGLYQ